MKKFLHLNEWLADETERQREFPVTLWQSYLAHAAVAPLPHCAAEAMKAYLAQAVQHGQLDLLHYEIDQETRALAASLLDTRSEEIAFVPSALAGLATVAAGIDWQVGDSIVLAEHDLLTQAPVWQTLMRRGVRVQLIPTDPERTLTATDVAAHLSSRTKMVVLSTAHPITGAPLDVQEIGDFLNQQSICFGVDATGTLGNTHTTLAHVDFLAADAHKWLMGPQGLAVLGLRRELMAHLRPAWIGQYAVPPAYASLAPGQLTADSAQRFEFGNANVLGLVGLHASLSLLVEIGVHQIAARLADLRRFLLAGLAGQHIEPLEDPFCELPRTVTCVRLREREALALYERLNEAGIIVSLCPDPRESQPGHCLIRIAPHFYNSFGEIQRLLEMVDRCMAPRRGKRAVAHAAFLS
jgi:selenocysteine lyase/cysteine desulfurase